MIASIDGISEQLSGGLRQLLAEGPLLDPFAPLQPVEAFFIYRLLLGRNPGLEDELPRAITDGCTRREFLARILQSEEFSRCPGFIPPGHVLMGEVEGFRFWFDTNDREMGVPMALGQYEPSTTELLKRIVKPGMRCLDIGAQTGYFTCLMAALTGASGKVIAFEPMPRSFELLQRNLAENGFEERVQALPYACSERRGTLAASFVSNMFVAGDVGAGERVEMQAVRADDVVGGRVDLIKIDIEGHEPAALRGMASLLSTRPLLVSEANEYWLRTCSGSSAAEYVGQLNSLGYDVYDVEDLSRPLDRATFSLEAVQTVNLLALPVGARPQEIAAVPGKERA